MMIHLRYNRQFLRTTVILIWYLCKDTAADANCSTSQHKWHLFMNSDGEPVTCFYISGSTDTRSTFEESSVACEILSGTLASIQSQGQFNLIKEAISCEEDDESRDCNYWVGLRRDGDKKEETTDWLWTDASNYNATVLQPFWASGEPTGGERHARLRRTSNVWELAGASNTQRYGYICEKQVPVYISTAQLYTQTSMIQDSASTKQPDPRPTSPPAPSIGLIVGSVVGAVILTSVLFVIGIVLFIRCRRKKRESSNSPNEKFPAGLESQGKATNSRSVSYAEIGEFGGIRTENNELYKSAENEDIGYDEIQEKNVTPPSLPKPRPNRKPTFLNKLKSKKPSKEIPKPATDISDIYAEVDKTKKKKNRKPSVKGQLTALVDRAKNRFSRAPPRDADQETAAESNDATYENTLH